MDFKQNTLPFGRRQSAAPAPVRAGALTLLITVAALCLAVLAALSLATARADRVMADRQLALAQLRAQAECTGQEWLAELDAALAAGGALPAGARMESETECTAALAVGQDSTLNIALRLGGAGRYTVTGWQLERGWQPDTGLNLWAGATAENAG